MDARMKRIACVIALAWPLALAAQDAPAKLAKRYGYSYEPNLYSQKTPQEALQAVVRALDRGKIDYLLAHLADPKFVDDNITLYAASYKGSEDARTVLAFERLARETVLHFQDDPLLLKELRQYVKEADWEVQEDTAIGTLKNASPRRVFFRKLEERWFLENKQQ
jgi:hypothetical protein